MPQTNEAGVNATPELKDATVTLPEGMTVDPSAANGLQACSNAQFGLGSTRNPLEPAACPLASQIGTVEVTTPLLEKPLEGQVFLGEPECSPCSTTDAEDGRIFRLFLQARSAERGVIVKLAGHVSANPTTGRLQATFTEQPQLPFSELLLTFNGGERASLANPQTCGTFTTTTDLTPWSTSGLGWPTGTEPIAGTPDATPSSSFNVDWNGAGGACPARAAVQPVLQRGQPGATAGSSSPFSVRSAGKIANRTSPGITVSTPPGLLGKIAGIPQCPEAQANAGTCSPEVRSGRRPWAQVRAAPVLPRRQGVSDRPATRAGRSASRSSCPRSPARSTSAPSWSGPDRGQPDHGGSLRSRPIRCRSTVDGVQLGCARSMSKSTGQGSCSTRRAAPSGRGRHDHRCAGRELERLQPVRGRRLPEPAFAPALRVHTGMDQQSQRREPDVSVSPPPGQANIAKVDLQLPKRFPRG